MKILTAIAFGAIALTLPSIAPAHERTPETLPDDEIEFCEATVSSHQDEGAAMPACKNFRSWMHNYIEGYAMEDDIPGGAKKLYCRTPEEEDIWIAALKKRGNKRK
ncbi:MAG: hypothetical protein HY748_02985 [Elusimicrobia bacterium]|nr:hypothetical protein [Elusimicrobiota bacterium]